MQSLRSGFLALLLFAGAPAIAQQAPPGPAAETSGRQLFIILYRPGPSWVAGRPMAQQNLREHGLYYRQLMEQGRVFAGGGYVGLDGGMGIIWAADRADAEAVLAADPAIRDGVFAADLRQWSPRFVADRPLIEPAR